MCLIQTFLTRRLAVTPSLLMVAFNSWAIATMHLPVKLWIFLLGLMISMMETPMLSPILWLATKTGLSQTVIKWAGGALMIVAAIIAFNLWQADVKRDAVADDRAAAKVKADKAQEDATKAADAKASARDEKSRELAKQLNERIENAKTAHPIDAARPSGPATNAALDELRRRKASLR